MSAPSTWNELCANAELFHLDNTRFAPLQKVYEKYKDLFDVYSLKVLQDFPMQEVENKIGKQDLPGFLLLCVTAHFGGLKDLYTRNNWSDEMYERMIPDFRIWQDTLLRDLGGYGLTPRIFGWATACLKGQIKPFGRLQAETVHFFEPSLSVYRNAGGSLEARPAFRPGNPPHPALTKGDKCINFHIPASGPLNVTECIRSLRRITEFVKAFQPDYEYKAIVGYSWMLDPKMQTILKPASNVCQFQQLGHGFTLDVSQTQETIWRIWGNAGCEMPVEQLPERNSMERAVGQFIKGGGEIKEGVLVIFPDELPSLFERINN